VIIRAKQNNVVYRQKFAVLNLWVFHIIVNELIVLHNLYVR